MNNLPFELVREVPIITTGSSDGEFPGGEPSPGGVNGIINVVTKSGTNDWRSRGHYLGGAGDEDWQTTSIQRDRLVGVSTSYGAGGTPQSVSFVGMNILPGENGDLDFEEFVRAELPFSTAAIHHIEFVGPHSDYAVLFGDIDQGGAGLIGIVNITDGTQNFITVPAPEGYSQLSWSDGSLFTVEEIVIAMMGGFASDGVSVDSVLYTATLPLGQPLDLDMVSEPLFLPVAGTSSVQFTEILPDASDAADLEILAAGTTQSGANFGSYIANLSWNRASGQLSLIGEPIAGPPFFQAGVFNPATGALDYMAANRLFRYYPDRPVQSGVNPLPNNGVELLAFLGAFPIAMDQQDGQLAILFSLQPDSAFTTTANAPNMELLGDSDMGLIVLDQPEITTLVPSTFHGPFSQRMLLEGFGEAVGTGDFILGDVDSAGVLQNQIEDTQVWLNFEGLAEPIAAPIYRTGPDRVAFYNFPDIPAGTVVDYWITQGDLGTGTFQVSIDDPGISFFPLTGGVAAAFKPDGTIPGINTQIFDGDVFSLVGTDGFPRQNVIGWGETEAGLNPLDLPFDALPLFGIVQTQEGSFEAVEVGSINHTGYQYPGGTNGINQIVATAHLDITAAEAQQMGLRSDLDYTGCLAAENTGLYAEIYGLLLEEEPEAEPYSFLAITRDPDGEGFTAVLDFEALSACLGELP